VPGSLPLGAVSSWQPSASLDVTIRLRSGVDHIDTALVRALQADGRAGHLALAKKVGLSRAATAVRVERLLDTGVIRVVGVLHPYVLGLRGLAHLSLIVDGPTRPVAEQIARLDVTPFVSIVSGAYAIITELRVADMTALLGAVSAIRDIPGVRSLNTLTYVELVKDVLSPAGVPTVEVDSLDVRLLGLLQDDGRLSYVALAERLGVSAASARTRLLRLIDGGVVHVGALVRRTATDREVAAGLGVTAAGTDEHLVTELAALPEVEFLARTTGRFDIVAAVRVSSNAALVRTLDRVRALRDASSVETWAHLEVIKESYDYQIAPAQRRSGGRRALTSAS